MILNCSVCAVPFRVRPSRVAIRKTCSYYCRDHMKRSRILSARAEVSQPADFKIIPLANGDLCYVSNEDFGWLGQLPWSTTSRGYVCTSNSLSMHIEVVKRCGLLKAGLEVDHMNGNKLDNRRENLRAVSRTANAYNKGRYKATKSIYKGVQRKYRRWTATIKHDGKSFYIGSFATALEAAYAYEQWAIQLHGDYARLDVLKGCDA